MKLYKSAYTAVPFEYSANEKPIYLTQKDIRKIQLAKGTVKTRTSVLLKHAQFKEENINDLIIRIFQQYTWIPVVPSLLALFHIHLLEL